MNKRGVEKETPKIKYSFKIENEGQLMVRIEKMIAIKDDERNKRLEIQYRERGKKVKVSKRYKIMDKSAAWGYMRVEHSKHRSKLMISIF